MKLVEIIRPMEVGATFPYKVKCDNGKIYIIKFPGNPEGVRALVNEYVCARLAKIFEIPIPPYELVYVDNINEFADDLSNIDLINGTSFCSEFIEKSAPVPDFYILTKVTNSIDALKTLLFDVIIGNNDRNLGNILINFKNNTFVAIDHSHVFINETVWDAVSLRRAIEEDISIDNLNKKTFDLLFMTINEPQNRRIFAEYINNAKKISEEMVSEIVYSIPEDWNVSNEEKQLLIRFIMKRIEKIDHICTLLKIGGV